MISASSKLTERTPLERIFGPDGWLARNHPRYEYRPGQLEMAQEVEAVGVALMRLEETIKEIGARFGLSPEDLNLDLGPLGKLI